MEKEELLKKIKQLPQLPGVYQYFDKNGKLLYIGKAKNLQKRVKSYWRFNPIFKPAPNLSPRILKMLFETYQLDFIVVDREDEALILENSLIKQLKPKYNILLRDDKTYPYIYIDNSQPFPRFEITRKVLSKKEIEYFGPFPNGAKALLDSIYELYPLVQKKSCLREKRACLFYQIKRCLAPCEGLIDSTTYKKITKEAKEAILNKNIIIEKLTSKMLFLAQKERFEEAAILRDKIKEIEKINISSNIDLAKREDIDIFAIDINKDLKRGV
ncbi:MAG: GIY-YIG nuclease family protein, partial [Epsilonproteobacteria bacterium]|nr:GIY-YIG nuclease family protein [Campylobacterota bacterium]